MKKGKKAQGLPMYAIGILVIGVILLALVLIYIFGVSGQGTDILDKIFGAQKSATAGASGAVNEITGKLISK